MATAVLEYRDPALVERLGAAAYRLMASHFSVDAMVDNIQRVYGTAGQGALGAVGESGMGSSLMENG
jgi:hypothetical protein